MTTSRPFENSLDRLQELPPDLKFLAGPDPLPIMDRLYEEDVILRLAMPTRIDGLVAQQGVLVSQMHLLEKWLAQMALRGFDESERFGTWLYRCGDDALDNLLSQQALEEQAGTPVARSRDLDLYQLLADDLGVELSKARSLCVTIHSLPLPTRQAFRALTVDLRTIPETTALMKITEDELGMHLHRAFEAIQKYLDGGIAGSLFTPGGG